MKNLKNKLNELDQQLKRDFQLIPTDQPIPSDFEDLKSHVTSIISELMDNDMEKLLLIFYRIDVSENKVKEILTANDPGNMAEELAELVIERELEKVVTRKKYQ